MTVRATGFAAIRSALAFLLCLVLVAGAGPGVLAQESTAAIAGVILDPEGKPAAGFKAVLHDAASNKDFISDPTDAQGNYSAKVPVGGRYKLTGVIANDGVTKLPVQDVPPVNVLTAGTTRLNVRFTSTTAPATPAVAGNTATEDQKKKDKAAVPWYRRPGPIVGMVLGGLVIVALAAGGGGGGSNDNVSPSFPNP
jgi:hypothetical protein